MRRSASPERSPLPWLSLRAEALPLPSPFHPHPPSGSPYHFSPQKFFLFLSLLPTRHLHSRADEHSLFFVFPTTAHSGLLDEALRDQVEEIRGDLQLVKDSTLKSYHSRITTYEQFCATVGYAPYPLNHAKYEVFGVWYCLNEDGDEYRSASSVRHILSALHHFEYLYARTDGHPPPTWPASCPDGRLVVLHPEACRRFEQALGREFPTASRRKLPLTLHYLRPIFSRMDLSQWRHLCDRAWLALGHAACLRIGELLRLRWCDLAWLRSSPGSPPTQLQLFIAQPKTGRFSHPGLKGMQSVIVAARGPDEADIDAVSFVKELGLRAGALLPPCEPQDAFCTERVFTASQPLLQADGTVRSGSTLSANATAFVINSRLVESGLSEDDAALYTNHSLRSGGASDMLAAGLTGAFIQMHGRWESAAFMNYLRPTENSAELARRTRPAARPEEHRPQKRVAAASSIAPSSSSQDLSSALQAVSPSVSSANDPLWPGSQPSTMSAGSSGTSAPAAAILLPSSPAAVAIPPLPPHRFAIGDKVWKSFWIANILSLEPHDPVSRQPRYVVDFEYSTELLSEHQLRPDFADAPRTRRH